MTNTSDQDPLYYTDEKPVYPQDFAEALKTLGITRGDCILVHSDIAVFGKLASYDREHLFSSLINELKNAVGEDGTIIMPTFSYSFCENKVFESVRTKSRVGVLTEYFRTLPDVVRTIHPIFSFAIWGENKESYLSISKDSFDSDSVFGKLHKNQGKILFLGASFQSCTFIHYIEQMHGVPYRFFKKFEGTIRNGNQEYQDTFTYLVRYLDNREVVVDLSRFEKHLLNHQYLKKAAAGNGNILSIEAERLFLEGSKQLDNDISFFLKTEFEG